MGGACAFQKIYFAEFDDLDAVLFVIGTLYFA